MLENFTIMIPTRGRVERQITLHWLPREVLGNTILVCPKEEVKALRAVHPVPANVWAQPASIDSIAKKRAWIIKNCPTRKLLMLDDDLAWNARQEGDPPRCVKKFTDGVTRLLKAPEKQVLRALEEFSGILDKYAHAGFDSRLGNNRRKDGYAYNARMMHALGYNVEIARKELKFNRVNLKEDFDFTLQLLRKGHKNCIVLHTCVSPAAYGLPGGCTDERAIAGHSESAEKLAELHPGLVHVVDRNYKGIPRKEVIVHWKKAFGADGGAK